MNEKLRSDLWQQYGRLFDVAEVTVARIGEEPAWFSIAVINDWSDLWGAILESYASHELLSSLVFADFLALPTDIRWMQLPFFAGHYAGLYRNLRFVWELIFRAYHADTYSHFHPGATDGPGPSLDDKVEWLKRERRRLGWGTVIAPALRQLLPLEEQARIDSDYHLLWERLNESVHPSGEWRERMIGDSVLLAGEDFDAPWATESLTIVARVFDTIWLAVLDRFPASLAHLTHPQTFASCPLTRRHMLASTKGLA